MGDNDTPILVWTHRELGLVLSQQDAPSAEKHLRTAIEIYERSDQTVDVAVTYRALGDLLRSAGDGEARCEAYRTGPWPWSRAYSGTNIDPGRLVRSLREGLPRHHVSRYPARRPDRTRHMDWKLLLGLTEDEVAEVLSVGRRRRFARREVIWHEGDRADTLHFVESGQVAVQVVTSLGEVATGAVWGPGEVAGMIDGYAAEVFHPTSAYALQATETHAIRIDDFNDLRRRLPALDDALIEFFADKVQDLLSQLLDAHYVNVDARVVRRLAALAAIYDRGESEVEIPLTQEDIASLVGATRPSVNRVLKKEETKGSIRLGRASITIIDKEALSGRTRPG